VAGAWLAKISPMSASSSSSAITLVIVLMSTEWLTDGKYRWMSHASAHGYCRASTRARRMAACVPLPGRQA
jgi:hypothetical protein